MNKKYESKITETFTRVPWNTILKAFLTQAVFFKIPGYSG